MALPILHSFLGEYPEDAYAWADFGKGQAQLGQNEAAVNSRKDEPRYVTAIIYRNLEHRDLSREQMTIFLEHSKKNPNQFGGMSSGNDDTEKAESHEAR